MSNTQKNIPSLTGDLKKDLTFLAEKYNGKIAFSTSFGQEDQVITDLIFKYNIPIRVFTLDTGRLFSETYEVHANTLVKYKKDIEVYFPEADKIENLLKTKGPNSFYNSVEDRKECCFIRKVQPLKRALEDVDCWVTGLRAGQSEGRKDLNQLEYDAQFDLIKYNPLINWTLEETVAHLDAHKVPYNALHAKGFLSIGCAPCTRALEPGEDLRAGRWWWEASKKECGLHENYFNKEVKQG